MNYSGLLQIRVAKFVLVQQTKSEKYTKMATIYTKWPCNIPNACKIFQMATKYANFFIPRHSKLSRSAFFDEKSIPFH
jgi:hypothetical protein